jgi:hypothetical protein
MAWIVILDLKCPLIHLTGLLGNESISLFLTTNPNRVTPWTFFDYEALIDHVSCSSVHFTYYRSEYVHGL